MHVHSLHDPRHDRTNTLSAEHDHMLKVESAIAPEVLDAINAVFAKARVVRPRANATVVPATRATHSLQHNFAQRDR